MCADAGIDLRIAGGVYCGCAVILNGSHHSDEDLCGQRLAISDEFQQPEYFTVSRCRQPLRGGAGVGLNRSGVQDSTDDQRELKQLAIGNWPFPTGMIAQFPSSNLINSATLKEPWSRTPQGSLFKSWSRFLCSRNAIGA